MIREKGGGSTTRRGPRGPSRRARALLGASPSARAQDVPAVLTDKIYKGHGVIDILKDVSAAQLAQYFDENGRLMLGIDVNEDASGNESNLSEPHPQLGLVRLRVEGLDLRDATVVWEVSGDWPVVSPWLGRGPRETTGWIEAEALWPDGRRAFAVSDAAAERD